MSKKTKKRNWLTRKVLLYFTGGEMSEKDLYELRLERGIYEFERENEKGFLELINSLNELDKTDIAIKEEDIFETKYGDYQVDVIVKDNLYKSYIWIKNDKKGFYIEWNRLGFKNFKDFDNFDIYFPIHLNKLDKEKYLMTMFDDYPLIHFNAKFDFEEISTNIIHPDRFIVLFSILEEELLFQSRHKKGENPFKKTSWDFKNGIVTHNKRDGSKCSICNTEKTEENIICKYFDFGKRKGNIMEWIFEEPLTPKIINDFIENMNMKDVWRIKTKKTKDDFHVDLAYYLKYEPYISLKVVIGNVPMILKNIKWKKKSTNYGDLFELKNWDYKNALLSHMDVFDRYKQLEKYILVEECCFCNQELLEMEESSCGILNDDLVLKREIMKKFFSNKEESGLFPIFQMWIVEYGTISYREKRSK